MCVLTNTQKGILTKTTSKSFYIYKIKEKAMHRLTYYMFISGIVSNISFLLCRANETLNTVGQKDNC